MDSYNFNTCSNLNYNHRSQTLQPIRAHAFSDTHQTQYQSFMVKKYLNSLSEQSNVNYENVRPPAKDLSNLCPSLSMRNHLNGSGDVVEINNSPSHHRHHQNNRHNQLPSPLLHTTNPMLAMPRSSLHHHKQLVSAAHPDSHQLSLHNRSHSPHYYHTSLRINDGCYYNVETVIPARSRHLSPPIINGADHKHHHNHHHEQPSMLMHNVANHHHQQINHLEPLTVMQVCMGLNEIVDASPPLPPPRDYTIVMTQSCGLVKVPFPQRRCIKGQFTDPRADISLKKDTYVTVLHPSRNDRSKFTVCLDDQIHIDMPNALTHLPQLDPHWNY